MLASGEDGPARPGKGRGRGRRRPGKRQRETASADQDHDQDWRRGRWGRQADDGGDDHNDRGTEVAAVAQPSR